MGRIKPSRLNSSRQRTRDRAAGVYMPTYQEVRLPGLAGALARLKAQTGIRAPKVSLRHEPTGEDVGGAP
jgi:hypothetical protein